MYWKLRMADSLPPSPAHPPNQSHVHIYLKGRAAKLDLRKTVFMDAKAPRVNVDLQFYSRFCVKR